MREPVYLSWSGGKDSALALHALMRSDEHEVVGLLCTLTAGHDRVSVHGVRRSLLEAQARASGIPVRVVEIPPGAGNAEYEARQGEALRRIREGGVATIAFGDLFLEEVRAYRERLLAPLGMRGLFPLWGRDTAGLAREFVALGFGAVLVCVDGHVLPSRFAGRDYDPALLAELPPAVDPCGENGEFHTFVHRGPVLSAPLDFERGEVVERDGRFWYVDLLPTSAGRER